VQLLANQWGELKIYSKAVAIIAAPALPAFYEALGTMAECIMAPAQWELDIGYSPDVAKEAGIERYGPTVEEFLRYFRESPGESPITTQPRPARPCCS